MFMAVNILVSMAAVRYDMRANGKPAKVDGKK